MAAEVAEGGEGEAVSVGGKEKKKWVEPLLVQNQAIKLDRTKEERYIESY